MLLFIALVLFISALCTWFYILELKKAPLPPGPIGVPIFGVLPFINKGAEIKFQEYYKKYGRICSFYMGSMLVVLLSDYAILKEALIKQADNFSGRPRSFPFRVFPDDEGLITSDGYLFKQFKRFTMSTLKDFGSLPKHFEIIVQENANSFIDYLKTKENQSLNILEPLGLSITQTYCQILLGRKFDYKDPTFKKIVEMSYRVERAYTNGVRIYLPWTRKIPFIKKFIGENEICYAKKELHSVFGEIVDENFKNYVKGSRDSFIHSWFTEDFKRKSINPSDNVFSKQYLVHNIDFLLVAAYETTTTTLRWAFLYLLENPTVQKKMIQELDEVIGTERVVTLDDVNNLPYVCAVIHEVHRIASIVPLAVIHRNHYETILDGFRIPQSSVIIPNLTAVHFNPSVFDNPTEFRPERFIDSESKFCKHEHVIPFSLGKRQCPGEQMAQIELFLYLTYILQHFSIEKADANESLVTHKSDSISSAPMDFNMRFIKRK